MADKAPIALDELQLRLAVPQHMPIHVCEKRVIEPDFAETSARGKHRSSLGETCSNSLSRSR
jgi:hypothetical protein